MGISIGIDLGTGTSSVAVFKNGKAEIIPNAEGEQTTPSFVALANKEWLVGTPAQRQAITNPKDTVYIAKRFIGMDYNDATEAKSKVAYTVKANSKGEAVFDVGGKDLSPQEAGAKILAKLKKSAEDYLGETIDDVVISVPAYFDQKKRQATVDAGHIAGFKNVLRIVNEPTAGALAFGLDKKKDAKILIFDLGSGTCDVSAIDTGDNVIEVLASAGEHFLGGTDVDDAIVGYLADQFKAEHGIDLRTDKMALQRLKTEAEKSKKELSNVPEIEVNIPFITADASGPKHLLYKLSRAKLESMIAPLVDKAFSCIDRCLTDAKLKPADIDEVVFVGGSTRIPIFAERAKKMFGKEPNRSVNPDHAVALGAAIQAGILSGNSGSDLLLLDVVSLSLGLETLGGVQTVLIPRNTTIPVKKSQDFSTAADNQTSVTIRVAQGERPMFADNQLLGTFNLDGIPPARRGTAKVTVEFDIDANGIVNVSATDAATKKTKNITIKSGLSKEEIEKMVAEAKQNEEADKRKAELVQNFNSLDGLILNTRKMLDENQEKLTAHKEALEAALESAQKVLDARDEAGLDREMDALQKAAHKAAETLYAAQAAPTQGPVEATVEPGQ